MNKIPHFKFGSSSVCTYCGDTADGIDHVICIASQTDMRKRKGVARGFGPTTYSCSGCNTLILGAKMFGSFWERCAYVSMRLNRKADPVHWSEQQLSELNYNLRTFIENENRRRLWYRFRSDWFQGRDFMLGLESLRWERSLDPMSPSYSVELYSYFSSTIAAVKRYLAKE